MNNGAMNNEAMNNEAMNNIAADYKVEFEATEDLARRSIADAEAFLTKAREIVAEALEEEGDVGRPA